jgi:hypothetical protein
VEATNADTKQPAKAVKKSGSACTVQWNSYFCLRQVILHGIVNVCRYHFLGTVPSHSRIIMNICEYLKHLKH